MLYYSWEVGINSVDWIFNLVQKWLMRANLLLLRLTRFRNNLLSKQIIDSRRKILFSLNNKNKYFLRNNFIAKLNFSLSLFEYYDIETILDTQRFKLKIHTIFPFHKRNFNRWNDVAYKSIPYNTIIEVLCKKRHNLFLFVLNHFTIRSHR